MTMKWHLGTKSGLRPGTKRRLRLAASSAGRGGSVDKAHLAPIRDVGLQEALFGAAVIADALEAAGDDFAAGHAAIDRVGPPDFAAAVSDPGQSEADARECGFPR